MTRLKLFQKTSTRRSQPHHLIVATLFIRRIFQSTHLHFLTAVLIINTSVSLPAPVTACAACLRGTRGTRSTQELSTASSRPALRSQKRAREVLSIPPPCPLHGPCSLRSLKDNDPFSKKRGKKRARVSKHCLFADGMSKKKRLINQIGEESLLFIRELAYLSSLTSFSPPFSCALRRSQRRDRARLFLQVSYNFQDSFPHIVETK